MPDNRVYFLAEAPDGAIWACTESGLARFDGQNWTTLNTGNSGLPSNKTRRIAFDKAGGMYVTYWPTVQGATGATVAELRSGVWTELMPPGWENTVNEAADAFIVDSQNRLWFAEFTGPGVYRYDPMLVHTENPAAEPAQFSVFPNPATEQVTLNIQAASTAWPGCG
ncbi:MAG: hypothetical protein IPL27_17990 [Lewinellaceae bacterium]|nr:hypothetical protein [Lewinellaceae bacterium]